MAEDQSLRAEISGDEIVIRCGIRTLATAAENYPELFEYPRNQWPPFARVINPLEFAKEVVRALGHEEDDGSGPMTEMFDWAINHAIDNGALGIVMRSECSVCRGTGNLGDGEDFETCHHCDGKGSDVGFESED